MEDRPFNIPERKRIEYFEEKQQLAKFEFDSYTSFDKALLLLSSGALGLSVTFLEKLYTGHVAPLILVVWVCWLVSLYLQLKSHQVSSKIMREEQEILNEHEKDPSKGKRPNPYYGKALSLSRFAGNAFFLGTVLFMVFAAFNTPGIIESLCDL